MTSDFEKRSQGSTETTGSPVGGTQQGSSSGGTTVAGDVASAVDRETNSAKAEFGSAKEQVRQGVSSLGETAREKATEGVEMGKAQITSNLGDFAAAVRKASDELGERDQSMAAGLVREVANGLEQATGAIQGRSVQDLTRSVAAFARRQPTTFLIGAALAGVALGRFARASGEHAAPDAGRWNASNSGRGEATRYGDDLYRNDGGDTRGSGAGQVQGRGAISTPVAPPVSAGTTTTVTGSTSGGSVTHGARPDSLGTSASATRSSGPAPAEGPSGAFLGHGSGSFNPKGDGDVR